jgi:hypothetical protein
MKKLMIAAAIVCAAAISQAATVLWGGAVATPDGGDTLPAGTQAALLYSSTAFSGTATTLDGWTVGSTADNGGSLVQLYSMTSGDSSNWAFQGTYSVDGSVDGYYAVLVLNDAGDYASYYDVGNISGTTGASSPTNIKVNMEWTGGEYLTSGGYTVAVGAVPEPTSGLLLLLGMAGLALKRKRA